ncbi:FCD domain-containing protein [uncultured Sphaerochaeta sp.]|uniref:FadR/GntR family transcriptional regulator n=1 Tax=uncultured Sphaerochaeta sp. TaxID=886478 RepID=UPI002A0A383A|nr:FCD domain-containing protein [uncultured Sphaerochaeta sp.]
MARERAETSLFTNKKVRSAVEITIETIRDLLISRQLKPGDKLPSEIELSENLQISRGSIREAMKILASYGIINIRRGDGTYIAKEITDGLFDHLFLQMILTDIDKKRLFELRELIEMGMVKLVIENASDDDLSNIRFVHEKMVRAYNSGNCSINNLAELDKSFHIAIADATKNLLIKKIYGFTLDLYTPSIITSVSRGGRGEYSVQHHELILEGLEERNSEKAIQAIKNSIEKWYILID